MYKMETQNTVNLLNDTDGKSSKFTAKKWNVINDQNNAKYGKGNENYSDIKFEIKAIKSNLCNYSDAYILVTGDVAVVGINADTNVAFQNYVPFTRCVSHINGEHVGTAKNLDIIMLMYNLVEYSEVSGSL